MRKYVSVNPISFAGDMLVIGDWNIEWHLSVLNGGKSVDHVKRQQQTHCPVAVNGMM